MPKPMRLWQPLEKTTCAYCGQLPTPNGTCHRFGNATSCDKPKPTICPDCFGENGAHLRASCQE